MPAPAARPWAYCSRLNGLTTRKRPPFSKSTDLLNVTRPMTVPSFKSNPRSRFVLVHDADDQPPDRAFFDTHGLARRQSIRRKHDLLVHARAVGINRHHR